LALCLGLAACSSPSNHFGALTSEGELMADGGGECGAVAIDADHVITARHCAGLAYYHPPGGGDARRVRAAAIGSRDIACLTVRTDAPTAVVGPLYMDAALRLEGNVSGEVAGTVWDQWIAALPSQRGDSGSGVYDETGALVGIVSRGVNAVDGRAQLTALESAVKAAELCAQ
jgi:V8-like Glu-specific endopeptidase